MVGPPFVGKGQRSAGPGISPHFTQRARQLVGSTWTTSLRPQIVQKRGGSLARRRASQTA